MANATIVVQFGTPGDSSSTAGHLSAEIDSRPDGLNAGKTSFVPGDSVAILVYKTSNVTIDEVGCSSGSIRPSGTTTVSRTEDLTFANSKTSSLSAPATGGLTTTWLGRSLGSLSRGPDGTTVTAGSSGIAVARVTYTALAHVYTINSPASIGGETDFSVAVVIAGEAS